MSNFNKRKYQKVLEWNIDIIKTKQNIIDIFNEEDDLEKYFKEYDQMREDKKWSLLLSGE